MIRHILKDGTRLDDITGHVVGKESAIYVLIDQIGKSEESEGTHQRLEQSHVEHVR